MLFPTSTIVAWLLITSAAAATTDASPSLPVRRSAVRKAPICEGFAPSAAARWWKASRTSATVKVVGARTSFLRSGTNDAEVYSDELLARDGGQRRGAPPGQRTRTLM
jgi:hypothetical protein